MLIRISLLTIAAIVSSTAHANQIPKLSLLSSRCHQTLSIAGVPHRLEFILDPADLKTTATDQTHTLNVAGQFTAELIDLSRPDRSKLQKFVVTGGYLVQGKFPIANGQMAMVTQIRLESIKGNRRAVLGRLIYQNDDGTPHAVGPEFNEGWLKTGNNEEALEANSMSCTPTFVP
jgi:hypothetical protein